MDYQSVRAPVNMTNHTHLSRHRPEFMALPELDVTFGKSMAS